MASGTWNTGSWGQNQWNDKLIQRYITGFGMSAALGTSQAQHEINTGWGDKNGVFKAWGNCGTSIPTGMFSNI